jgi:hypothetical protein
MAQRRGKPEAELVTAFNRYLDSVKDADAIAIHAIYGQLPDCLPEPVLSRILQAIATLRSARQSPQRMAKIVTAARNNDFPVPGTALDSIAFIDAANYLAHVQWALTLGKTRSIEELGGKLAAFGSRTRDQRAEFSRIGNESKKEAAEEQSRRWLAIGKPLRAKHPEGSDSWLAAEIARKCGGNKSTIRAAIRLLGLQKN